MRSIQQYTLVLMVVLEGCSSLHAGREPVTARKTPEVACAPDTTLPKEVKEPGSVLLFGEAHGTQELPAFFGEAVCTTVTSGLPVEVGFEMPKADQATVDSFLASPGGVSDVETLLATPWWSATLQDGRPSQARVALLQRLRQLRAQGLPLGVFLFDVDTADNIANRDKDMAESVAAHARAHPKALTMVLVGDLHAGKSKGLSWDPNYLPMGWHLREAGIRVRSLGRSTPAGTAWTCSGTSKDDMKCESSAFRATPPLPSGRTTGIELLPAPSKQSYDGLYATPSLTSSPPARSAQGAQR
jgi:hypothetical protein